uniref:RHS repeat-associated core domain-containing protein n=1 Tax=Pseudomonas anguilliseptica TaxID=53406 RepID=UPI003736AFE2
GQLVRQQEAGETLLTRSYLLSDRSSDVSKIAEAYRITGRSLAVTREISQRQGRAPSPYVAQMIEQDAQGNRTTTEYNKYSQVIRIQYADGSEIKNSYDPATNKISETINERGIKTQYRYDGKGNLLELIKGAGTPQALSVQFRYNELAQVIEEVHPLDAGISQNKWQYRYDLKGNLAVGINPLGHETRYSYDVLGEVTELTDAQNNRWASQYDAAGNLLSMTTALGHETRYGYDALGQLISEQAANGSLTTYAVNTAGFTVSITDAANARVQFGYDANQRLVTVTDPLGFKREYQYDPRGRMQGEADEAGNLTQYQYDKERLSGTDFPSFKARYKYDARDRLTEQALLFEGLEGEKNQSNQISYFADGLQQTAKDAAGNVTKQRYNALDQLVELEDGAGGVSHFAYDARGNLAQITDPAGRITRFLHDVLDRRVGEIKVGDDSTASLERRFEYDSLGNLHKVLTPDGRVSLYRYDADNRLVELSHYASAAAADAEYVTQYTYNVLDQLLSYEDAGSRAEYGYNELGQLIRTTVTYKSANPVFSKTYLYTYDVNGRTQTYSNPEQQTYTYLYSPHGQLAGVSIPGEGSISQQNFNWLQPQQTLFPGGSALKVVYDGLLRDAQRVLNDPAGNPIQRHAYSYDAVGNITAIETEEGTTRYSYDKRYHLTSADYPAGDSRADEFFAYDGLGNRLSRASTAEQLDISQWQYNAHNQLVSHDGIGYRYNGDGHLVEKGALQGENSLKQSAEIDHWRYQYDSRERLVEVQKNGQALVKYSYNPLGQRISKTLLGSNRTTYYLYSLDGLVGEYDEQGGLQQEYAYDPTAAWMSAPLFTRAKRKDTGAWAVSYYGANHMGTPEVAFEKSGEITWRGKARAFGETQVALNLIDNPLRFPGQYFDAETGLHYNYFRDYDPSLGRYIQADPLRLGGGANSYGYAYQDPLSLTDPTGEIVPIILGYARCVASCKLIAVVEEAITGECSDTLGDCMLDCLNPLKWFKIGKLGAKAGGNRVTKHTTNRHVDRNKYPDKSKFKKPSQLQKNIDKTVNKPDRVIPQGDRTRFERDFSRDIGTKGERTMVVVKDNATGKVVTSFPKL